MELPATEPRIGAGGYATDDPLGERGVRRAGTSRGAITSVWLYVLEPIIGGVLGALLYDRTMAQTQGPA